MITISPDTFILDDNPIIKKIDDIETDDLDELIKALGMDGVAFGETLTEIFKQGR